MNSLKTYLVTTEKVITKGSNIWKYKSAVFFFLVSSNGPPAPTSYLEKKSSDALRDVATPDLKSGKPSDVICIED